MIIKGWPWSEATFRHPVMFKKNAQMVPKRLNSVTKWSPTQLHRHQQQSELFIQERMHWSCLHRILTLPSESEILELKLSFMRLGNMSLIYYWPVWVCLWATASVQSTAITHSFQSSMCCAYRDGFLHTLLPMVGTLTFGFLSYLTSKFISICPLTSKMHFPPQLPMIRHVLSSFWNILLITE